MFNLLLNTLNGFYDTFLNCTFKGVPVVMWGMFAFVLGCIVRFILPVFRMNLNPGSLVSPVRRSITSDVGRRR